MSRRKIDDQTLAIAVSNVFEGLRNQFMMPIVFEGCRWI
jgi:hypothetical protein